MRRLVSIVALLVVLGLAPGPVAPVAAQGDAPTVGTDIPYVDAEGVERGLVTVSEVADPFTDFNPDQPPEAGSRYVLLTVAFEAAADQPFEADPYDLLFQDTDGYLWSPTSVPRPADVVIPELQSQTMAPGNRVSGVVGFVVPEDAELTGVHFQPESGRLVLLADLAGAAPGAESSATPATTDVAETTLVAGECEGVEVWLMATATRVQRAAAMSREDATLEDIAILEEHVTEYAALAAAQGTDPVPAAAVAINDLVIAVLTAYESALTQILAAEEPGKETALELVEAVNTFNDAGQQAGDIRQEIAALAAGCGIDL